MVESIHMLANRHHDGKGIDISKVKQVNDMKISERSLNAARLLGRSHCDAYSHHVTESAYHGKWICSELASPSESTWLLIQRTRIEIKVFATVSNTTTASLMSAITFPKLLERC
jgi:hypothetical protein